MTQTADLRSGPVRSVRWRRATVLARWLLVAVVMATVVRTVGLGSEEIAVAVGRFTQLAPVPMLAVLALQVAWATTLAATQRSAVLAMGGRVTRRDALRISMAGFTLSRVVPGGGAAGGLFAMRELHRLGQYGAVATVAMVASWATSITSLALLVLGGLGVSVALGGTVGAPVLSAGTVLAALAAAGAVVLGALLHPPLRRRVLAVVGRAARRLPLPVDVDGLERGLAELADSSGRRRYLWHSFCWAALAWVCDAAALWLVFLACGQRLSLIALLVGYGSANLLNSVPEVTPGWLGVFEAALSATYIGLGVPAGTAVAAVLVYRLASFWLPTAAGVVPVMRSLARGRRAAPRAPASPALAGVRMLAPLAPTSPTVPGAVARSGGATPGPVVLLGGCEHRSACTDIDRWVLDRVGHAGARVAVIPAASTPAGMPAAAALARTYWTALGARPTVLAPTADCTARQREAIAAADVVVLTGGVPGRLVAALGAAPLWEGVLDRWRSGAVLVGSSAGAMALLTWRLALRAPHPLRLVPGLGPLTGAVCIPHFDRFVGPYAPMRAWTAAVQRGFDGAGIVGIDEATALVVDGARHHVLGQGAVTFADGDGWRTTHARPHRVPWRDALVAAGADGRAPTDGAGRGPDVWSGGMPGRAAAVGRDRSSVTPQVVSA